MKTQAYAGSQYAQRDTALPTLSGTAKGEIGKADSIAQIFVAGEYYEVPVDPLTGEYTWTATVPFNDGDYSVSVTIKDRAGNTGKPALYTLRVDTTPPEAPVLLNLYDDQGAKTGSFDEGKTTDDKRPKLTGVAQKGATVYLQDESGKNIGSAIADEITGVWKMEPSEDLKDGVNTLTLVAEETFARKTRTGEPSASFTIVIGADTPVLPPNTITIKEAIDDVGTYTGKLASGALTDDTTPTLRGDVSAGSNVTVYYRLAGSSTWAGSATATVTGTEWSWTPGSALPYGAYEFQASIGGFSSSLFTLDIATAADIINKTRIETVKDDFGAWQGELSSGAITDDATPTFSGRGEANGKVVLRFAQVGQLANTAVVDVDSSGKWTWTPASGLPAGNWSFEVQPQGQTNWSDSFSLSITGSGGFNPVITEGFDDVGTTAVLHNNDTTDDTTPTLSGRAEANSMVYLRANTAIYSVMADTAGHWEWTPSSVLATGNWNFQVSKTSSGGWSDAFNLTLTLPAPKYYSYNFEGITVQLPGVDPITNNFENNKVVDTGSGLKIKNTAGISQLGYPPNNDYVHVTGGVTMRIGDKATSEFIFDGADQVSFQTIGGDSGQITITVYSTTNSIISHQTLSLNTSHYVAKNYSYQGNGQLIDKVVISVSDYAGVYIDNFNWRMPANTFSINESTNSLLINEFSVDSNKYTFNSKSETGEGLKVSLKDILEYGNDEYFISDGGKQALIKGNEGDVIHLQEIMPDNSDVSKWTQQSGTITIAGIEYNVYSHGDDAELLVQQGVKTELI